MSKSTDIVLGAILIISWINYVRSYQILTQSTTDGVQLRVGSNTYVSSTSGESIIRDVLASFKCIAYISPGTDLLTAGSCTFGISLVNNLPSCVVTLSDGAYDFNNNSYVFGHRLADVARASATYAIAYGSSGESVISLPAGIYVPWICVVSNNAAATTLASASYSVLPETVSPTASVNVVNTPTTIAVNNEYENVFGSVKPLSSLPFSYSTPDGDFTINLLAVSPDEGDLYPPKLGLKKFRPDLKKDLTRYGVEPNPGPPKMAKKQIKKAVKAIKKVVKGRGDYKKGKQSRRRKGGIKGKGDYFSDLGSHLGSKAGNWLGGKASKMLGGLFGFGDYAPLSHKPKSNSLLNGGMDPPKINNTGRVTTVSHREKVLDIYGSINFNIAADIPINPGLESYPYERATAANYQEYRILGQLYEFKSLFSEASAVGYLGEVIMCTNYDNAAPLFAGTTEMENTGQASAGKPSISMFHPIECAPAETGTLVKYIRTGAVPSTGVVNNFDWGRFQLATIGQVSDGKLIGELWVTYEIEFLKPIETTQAGALVRTAMYTGASAAYGVFDTIVPQSANSLDLTYERTVVSANVFLETFTFPSNLVHGTYLVLLQYNGSQAITDFSIDQFKLLTGLAYADIPGNNGNNRGNWQNAPYGTAYANVASAAANIWAIINLVPSDGNVHTFSFLSGSNSTIVMPIGAIYFLTVTQLNSLVPLSTSTQFDLLQKEFYSLKLDSQKEKEEQIDLRNELKRQSDLINQLISFNSSNNFVQANPGYVKVSQNVSEDEDEKSLPLSESFVNQFQSLVGSRLSKSKPSSIKSSN
jgi:hypothetical protein